MSDNVKQEIVVVPSSVYNNKIIDIFREVADKYPQASVYLHTSIMQPKYYLSFSEKRNDDGFNPFTTTTEKKLHTWSYEPKFSWFDSKRDTPFYNVKKKQLFFSQEDYEAHFTEIRDNIENIVAKFASSAEAAEEEGVGN